MEEKLQKRIDFLKKRTGVTKEQLERECHDVDLEHFGQTIAGYWKYANAILSVPEIENLDSSLKIGHSTQDKLAAAFQLWKNNCKFGDSKVGPATYLTLLKVALRQNDGNGAENICNTCKERDALSLPASTNPPCPTTTEQESKRLFDEAMKDGYVYKVKILTIGVTRSGKSSLMNFLLTDKPPPQQRNSTTLQLLAQTIANLSMIGADQSLGSEVTRALQKIAAQNRSSREPSSAQVSTLEDTQQAPTHEQIESVMSEVAKMLEIASQQSDSSSDEEEMDSASQQSEPSSDEDQGGELFDSTWMYISDCGGQPQFHDIIPLFVQHISIAVLVFRLIDDFSKFPLDEYYKDGQLVGLPHASHMTLGETLKNLIRSIESLCSQEKKPNLILVGTFLDQLESLVPFIEKNKAVLDMLSADMKKQVLYNEGLLDTMFVNPQVPLDKITELTEHAIALRNAKTKRVVDCEWKSFIDEGVIMLEFMQHKEFDKHYVDGIFSPEDMLLIMKELLVIAPIPLVGESDCPLSKAEYFMPSLLKSCPPAELEKCRTSSSSISPIAISFPSGCIRSGVLNAPPSYGQELLCDQLLSGSIAASDILASITELKKTTGVSDQQLDTEINERDFHKLGGKFNSTAGLLERFNFNQAEHADVDRTVDREGTRAGVAHALRLWRRMNPARATFRSLVEIVVSLRRGDIATEICKYIVDSF